MQQLFNILSKALSTMLHPLFMPTYGMGLYMVAMRMRIQQLPSVYILIGLAVTFVLTTLIPIILILILRKRGTISSIYIDEAHERTIPYIYTFICFGFWCYFVGATLKMPTVWLVVAIGATIALLFVTIINHWWKISAHLTALGGLLGGICSLALYYSTLPTTLIIGIMIISLLLMCARIYLNAHTPLQVICGFVLGILCTFIPNLITYHA